MKKVLFAVFAFWVVACSCQNREREFREDFGTLEGWSPAKKLVDPIALDSLLDMKVALRYRMYEKHDFTGKIDRQVIYSFVGDFDNPETFDGQTLYPNYEIDYDAKGRVVRLENKSKSDKNLVLFYYDLSGNLALRVEHYTDSNDKTYPITTRYSYDDFGNLISKYMYEVKNGDYKVSSYDTYKYMPKSDGVTVINERIEQFSGVYKTSEIMEFDSIGRMRSKQVDDDNVIARKKIKSQWKYFYNQANPMLLNKIEAKSSTDGSEIVKTFKHDNHNRFTEATETTRRGELFSSYRRTYDYQVDGKSMIFELHFDTNSQKDLEYARYEKSGLQERIKYVFDDSRNIILEEKSIPEVEVKRNDYTFDSNGNWIGYKRYYTRMGKTRYKQFGEENGEKHLFRKIIYVSDKTKFPEAKLPEPDAKAEEAKRIFLERIKK